MKKKSAPGPDSLRRQAEEKLNGSLRKANMQLSEADMLKLIHEAEVYKEELKLQNEELLLAKGQAEDARDTYTELYDFAPAGYFTLSQDGRIIRMNLSGAAMLGKNRSFLTDSLLSYYVSDDTKPVFNQFLNRIFTGKGKESCDITLQHNGNITPMYVHLSGVAANYGESCLVSIVDVSESRLLASLNKTLLDSLPYPAMYIQRKDRLVLSVNKSAADLGVKPGGYCWRDFMQSNFITDEEKEIAERYPGQVPAEFNIKCSFCQSDLCFDLATEQNNADIKAFGSVWNTYWIKVSNDVFLHYAMDITERRQLENISRSRLHLLEYAEKNTLSDLLEETLNHAEELTGSRIGFFHFVEADQKTLSLQNWSTRTKKEYCRAEGMGMHYDIDIAGVWVDCIREKRAVIHNNYASLPNKKGLPPGHAEVIREMTVPVIRSGKIMAIIGVGNKRSDYTSQDLELVSLFADLAWDITLRKRYEESLIESETRFRTTFDQSPVGSVIVGMDKRFIKCNEAFCNFLGYSEAELLGKTFTQFTFPDDIEIGLNALKQITTGEIESAVMQKRYLRKEGAIVWGEINLRLVRSDKNEPLYYIPVIQDITERKRMEEALLLSEKLYRELANSITDLFFEMDKDLRYTYWNRASENYTGIKASDAVGKLLFELFPKTSETIKAEAMYREIIDTQKSRIFESSFETDSHLTIFEIRAYPTVKGIAVLASDITERKQAEAMILAKNKQLHKLNTEKDKFFSIISHDLRGPFNSFLGLTQIMNEKIEDLSPVEIKQIAQSMSSSAANLYRLLENLLHWSRMQQGLIPFDAQEVNLHHVAFESIVMVREAALSKGIELVYDVPGKIMLTADRNMVQTVIRNLVSNAVKFTPRGGKITVSAKAVSDKTIEISIHDTGMGMDKEMLADLFRLDVNTSRKGTEGESSTGLGLMICKDFIEKHGGSIWAESEVDKGSTFHFTIPGHTADDLETNAESSTPKPAFSQARKKLKIIIAEDDETSEILLGIAMKEVSREIIKVQSGNSTVEACRNNPDTDLVLMDIKMPGLDGYEATRQIRQFNKDVIIISQTAYGQLHDRDDAIAAGCNDYIAKPIDLTLLRSMIKEYFDI